MSLRSCSNSHEWGSGISHKMSSLVSGFGPSDITVVPTLPHQQLPKNGLQGYFRTSQMLSPIAQRPAGCHSTVSSSSSSTVGNQWLLTTQETLVRKLAAAAHSLGNNTLNVPTNNYYFIFQKVWPLQHLGSVEICTSV